VTTMRARDAAQSERQTMIALADSGDCIDFWDIEVLLRIRGYSLDDARRAMADADTRRMLNERCAAARRGGLRRQA